MNGWIQVGIVFAVACVAALLILLLRRRLTFRRGVLFGGLAVIGAACLLLGWNADGALGEHRSYDQKNIERYFATVYLQNGRYEEAEEILNRQMAQQEDKEDLLLLARLNALQENYKKALLCYEKYQAEEGATAEQELLFVKTQSNPVASAPNGAVLKYLESRNITAEEAGLAVQTKDTEAAAAFSDEEEFAEAVLAALAADAEARLKKEEEKSTIKKGGEALLAARELFDDYLDGVQTEAETLSEVQSRLNRLVRADGPLRQNETIRNAALLVNALAGDAEAVAKNVDAHATVYELIVASELSMGGYVRERDFKNLEEKPDSTTVSLVYDQCKQIEAAMPEDKTEEEEQYYKSLLKLVKGAKEKYLLKLLLVMLSEKTSDGQKGEQSQAYLQLAKGYYYTELEDNVSAYLDLALEKAGAASNAAYAASMGELLRLVAGQTEGNSRNISDYVERALNQLMPVPMERFAKPEETASGAEGRMIALSAKDGKEEETRDFSAVVADKIVQKRATINIGPIDKSRFPEIMTTISFGADSDITEKNLKQKIALYDCGNRIKDFTATKVDNLTGKIILVCDMSGSMDDSLEEMKQALLSFADGMTEKEQVAVLGFNSGVVFFTDFLSDPEEVRSCADRLYASGGTSMYPSILRAAEQFTDGANDDNIMIVMTDGQDGEKPKEERLRTELKELVEKHSCTLYTVGLGSGVDDTYLSEIASIGNGQYLYVQSADSLDSFYGFIHSQVANRYVIRYQAVNTVLNERTVECSFQDAIGSVSKSYVLNGDAAAPEENKNGTLPVKTADGLLVYGFSSASLYQCDKELTLQVVGENFDSAAEYTLKLSGPGRGYFLTAVYLDEKTLSVTIPSGLSVGSYQLTVSDEKTSVTVENALRILTALDQKTFRFGAYVFTCEQVESTAQGVLLKDNVTLNGWLHFKGDVELVGNCDDTVSRYVTMVDRSGAYVRYSESGSTGFAKVLAKHGRTLQLPALGRFEIYSESYDSSAYEEFSVRKLTLNAPIRCSGLADVGGTVALYPDMIYSEAFYTQLDLKFLDTLLRNMPKNIYNRDLTGAFAITNNCFLLQGSLEVSYQKDHDTAEKFQLGSMGLCLNQFGLSLDTIKQEYEVECEVQFQAFAVPGMSGTEMDGVGLKLCWSGEGFDSFELSGSGKRQVATTPFPMYLTGLSVGAQNLSGVKKASDLLNVTVTGGFNLETVDVIEKVPRKVKEFFDMDELILAELDEARINVTLGKFNLNFHTNVKFLGMELGEGTINLGAFDYDNAVLGIQCEEKGAEVKLTVHPNIDWKNLKAELNASADLTLGYPFSGFTADGALSYDISWFIFHTGKDLYGDFGIGFLWNSDRELQFIVKAYGKNAKGKESGFRVDYSSTMGLRKTKY